MNLLEEDSAHGPTRQAASAMPFHLRRIMKGVRQMKKIRKLMSALLAMSLVFSLLAVSASAAGAEETGMLPFNLQALADQDLETASPEMKEAIMLARRLLASGSWVGGGEAQEGVFSTKDLAAMDTKTASPELRNAIMLARRLIVYGSQGWTVGGAVSEFDKETGEVTPLPEFSDLWPEWDLNELSLSKDPMYYTDTFWTGASGVNYPVKLHVLTEKERPSYNYEWNYYAHTVSTAYLSKNNAAGTNGGVCSPFTARRTSAVFLLTSAPGATDYNVQLYRGLPGQGERVSDYAKVAVNNGVYFLGLTVGENYYLKISSGTLKTDACTAAYSLFY